MKCSKCEKEKTLNQFYYQSCQNRREKRCIDCRRKYSREYNREHKKERREYSKKWYNRNGNEMRHKSNLRIAKNRKLNPDKYRAYEKKSREKCREKRRNDKKYCLDRAMSREIRRALKGRKAGRKWETLVGYTLKDLMLWLESQFDKNMSWNNRGYYWHIDHIKPKSLFKYEVAEDLGFRECWALDNLQPLEAIENKRKGNKYTHPRSTLLKTKQ